MGAWRKVFDAPSDAAGGDKADDLVVEVYAPDAVDEREDRCE